MTRLVGPQGGNAKGQVVVAPGVERRPNEGFVEDGGCTRTIFCVSVSFHCGLLGRGARCARDHGHGKATGILEGLARHGLYA
jgi:hypothetical protein